jgi:hypothetical protein
MICTLRWMLVQLSERHKHRWEDNIKTDHKEKLSQNSRQAAEIQLNNLPNWSLITTKT